MSESSFGPEPEDEKLTPAPRTRAGEFLADWLARRSEKKTETDEEEDDDSETGSVSSRWRRMFSRIFPRIASKDEVSGEPQQPSLFERMLTPDAVLETDEPERIIGEALPSETDLPKDWSEPAPLEETKTRTKEPITDAREPLNEAAAEKSITSERGIPAEIAEAETSRAPERVRPAPELGRTIYERNAEPIERIIERNHGGAAAAFIGGEVLSRWRDRKIRKKAAGLERVQRKEAAKTAELREMVQRSNEQIRELKEKRNQEQIPKPLGHVETLKVVERPESMRTAEKVEKVPDKTERFERVVSTRETEASFKTEGNVPPPEVIFKKVVEAAKHDEAIERKYERRQEVKDEPKSVHAFAGALPGGATPIGNVLNQAVQSSALNKQERRELAKAAEKAHRAVNKSIYRQAAIGGFWTGIIIAVTLAVVIIAA